jgi:PAS domain S-box-containing protein
MPRIYHISKLFGANVFLVCLAVSLVIAVIVGVTQYGEFSRNAAAYEQEYVARQKEKLQGEVAHALGLIRFERTKLRENLKLDMRQRVEQAADVALNLYVNNKNRLPEREVKRLIIETLEPARFYDGRGYYWIHDLDCNLVMNPFRPGRAGLSDLDLTDLAGKKIVQSFVRIAATRGEGFDTYYWNKPGQDVLAPKLSYVKLFKPYGWVIGTGDYLDDVEASVRQSIKDRLLLGIQSADVNLAVFDLGGDVIFDQAGTHPPGTGLIDLQDAKGRFVVQEFLSAGLLPEGGGGRYEESGPDGGPPTPRMYHAGTVPGWGWVVVVSVSLEAMDAVVFQHRRSLRDTMIRQFLFILGVVAAVAGAVVVLAGVVSRRLGSEFAVFSAFFQHVARGGGPIDIDRLRVAELRDLAVPANRMSEDLAASRGEILAKTAQLEEEVKVRKQAEAGLMRARDAFQDIIDSMPSVVAGVDGRMAVTHFNRAAVEATGLAAADVIGRPLTEVFPQMPALAAAVALSVREAAPVERPGERFLWKGEPKVTDMLVSPLISEGVRGAVIRIDDVTERTRMREMLVQSEKMMSVGGLAAGMAHEINNPLGGILQSAQVIKRRLSSETPASRDAAEKAGCGLESVRAFLDARGVMEMLEGIRQSAERAARIVSNMLEFSRKTDPAFKEVDIPELLDKAVELCVKDYDLKKRYDFKRILITKDFDPALGLVPCSPTEIEQVVMNILRNAAQAMAGSPGGDKPAIWISTRAEPESARITIADNGPGMDAGALKRVFEPFYSTKPPGEGTGLGLSVSYFIVTHKHGGTLGVESEPGRGARFIIRLPLRPARTREVRP